MFKIHNTFDFIKKAKDIHGSKYDYSLVNFINSRTKVKIICPEHGLFEQRANNHIAGKNGCPKCAQQKRNNKKLVGTQEFINRSIKVHGDKYNYSLVEYKKGKNRVEIICPIHWIFEQTPTKHMAGAGCPKCGGSKLLTTSEFVEKCHQVHGNTYDYSKVKYVGNKTKVTIVCKKHGEFLQKPGSHLSGAGCPICNQSKGELGIAKYLRVHNIIYIPQYKFDDCKNKRKLPFDFAIFESDGSLKFLIEYQGIQHFKSVDFFGGKDSFEYTVANDKIKKDYCIKNNILLYTITYKDNITKVLKGIFEGYVK